MFIILKNMINGNMVYVKDLAAFYGSNKLVYLKFRVNLIE